MIGRLKEFIKENAMTERNFALKCGIAQNTMNYYLNDKRKMSYENLERILLAFPDLSAEWLIRGKGKMYLSQNGANVLKTTDINKILDTIDALNGALTAQADTIRMLKDRIKELEGK